MMTNADTGQDLRPVADPNWPEPMSPKAYQGLAGEFVKILEPHTEADPAAILAQFLVAFGNVAGRSPHWRVEADRHHLNEFVAIVGPTAKGRKGTSWGPVREIMRMVDDDWVSLRIKTGLSSGEGLTYQVRDQDAGDDVADDDCEDDVSDDKRLMTYEPELASTLKVLAREGNTLSPVIRQAWDDGQLATLTKNSPMRATDAHISIVGHITAEELRRRLAESEIFNGFANRFLWICARRSKLLPHGGSFFDLDLSSFAARLGDAVKFARQTGEIKLDERARQLWASAYITLTDDEPGLIGAVLSRAEAHVLRLASLYAMLDTSCSIREDHLLCALSVWEYSERSARYIFGDRTGDTVADRIIEALAARGQEGLTKTEIRDLFDRNVSRDRLDAAIGTLMRYGKITTTTEKAEPGKPGRPVQRFYDITSKTTKTTQTTE